MRCIVLLAGALLTTGPALAAPYAFTPLPPLFFTANAINDLGQVGGEARPAHRWAHRAVRPLPATASPPSCPRPSRISRWSRG